MTAATRLAAVLTILSLWLLAGAQTAPAPKPYALTLKPVGGGELKVPAGDRPTVLLFARADQEQSVKAVEGLKAALKETPGVQVAVLFSGEQVPEAPRKLLKDLAWPVVMDADYALVGACRVHVWPTTIVISRAGDELAHLAGLPQTYARDLGAWTAFAAGAIDRGTLEKQLGATDVVADSHQQQANRHWQVAQRLLEKGLPDQARAECEQGLKLVPGEPRLLLLAARIALLQSDPAAALEAAEKLDEKAGNSGAIGTVKGGALVALKQPDRAIPILVAAVKLNPDPAETYYYLGLAYQQKGKTADAAAAFRAAFEHTPAGKAVSRVGKDVTRAAE